MNKSELITQVGSNTGLTDAETKRIIDETFKIMLRTLSSGDDVKIVGFANFLVKITAERMGRNPSTGESITIKAGRKITFKPSAELKNSL